jgi:hypothetical protein
MDVEALEVSRCHRSALLRPWAPPHFRAEASHSPLRRRPSPSPLAHEFGKLHSNPSGPCFPPRWSLTGVSPGPTPLHSFNSGLTFSFYVKTSGVPPYLISTTACPFVCWTSTARAKLVMPVRLLRAPLPNAQNPIGFHDSVEESKRAIGVPAGLFL